MHPSLFLAAVCLAAVATPSNARALKTWFNRRPPQPPHARTHKFVIPPQKDVHVGHAKAVDLTNYVDVVPQLSVWVARPRWSIAKEVQTYSQSLGTTERSCPKGARYIL